MGKNILRKTTKKNQDTQLLFDCEKREESFRCNYKDLYVWLWTFIRSFGHSRVAYSLRGIGWEPRTLLVSGSLWCLLLLTSTEASWNLNRGMANSRKLTISTNGFFWHNKSRVLTHSYVPFGKKKQSSSCHWKRSSKKHLEPQTMFSCSSFPLASVSREKSFQTKWLSRDDRKQFLSNSKCQEHLNKELKRSLEISIYLSIYL